MTRFFRPVLALGLLAASPALLTACDYAPYSPGKNHQFEDGFDGQPHGYTNADVNADSINYKQTVKAPTGEGSAAALKKGSAQDQLNSQPAGSSASAGQSASGQPAPADQQQGMNSSGPKGTDASAQKGALSN